MTVTNTRAILFLLLLGLAASWALLCPALIVNHDFHYAFVKAVAMSESWHQGDFSGRWTPDINKGLGYPMFNYYAPLFSYIAAALSFVLPMLLAFNMAVLFVFAGAGLAMYLWARDVWGRAGGLVAATAYLLAPYHFSGLYVRGVAAELTAYALFPVVLWALRRLARLGSPGVFGAAVMSLAGVLLAHNIMAMIFIPVAAFYAAIEWWGQSRSGRSGVLLIMAFLGAAALSAFFWAPALAEKGLVQLERIQTEYYDFRKHFVYVDQLIYSAWGKGISVPGRADGMSFMVGIGHLILALAGLLGGRLFRPFGDRGRQALFGLGLFTVACAITLEISRPLWETLPMLPLTQFPWRFLALASLGVSLLCGGVMTREGKAKRILLGASVGVLLLANLPLAHSFGSEKEEVLSRKDFLSKETPFDNMEYLPKGASPAALFIGHSGLQVQAGVAAIREKAGTTVLKRQYIVRALGPASLYEHVFNFPGWQVRVDGHEVAMMAHPAGLISFLMPAGEHQVDICFESTPVRAAAQRVSLITFMLLMTGICLAFILRGTIKGGGRNNV